MLPRGPAVHKSHSQRVTQHNSVQHGPLSLLLHTYVAHALHTQGYLVVYVSAYCVHTYVYKCEQLIDVDQWQCLCWTSWGGSDTYVVWSISPSILQHSRRQENVPNAIDIHTYICTYICTRAERSSAGVHVHTVRIK